MFTNRSSNRRFLYIAARPSTLAFALSFPNAALALPPPLLSTRPSSSPPPLAPAAQVSSYLTELTGLEASDVQDAPPLEEALVALRKVLPRDAVLVGQGIQHDIHWLGLRAEEKRGEAKGASQ